MLSIASADFNRDGKLDAISLSAAGNFTVLLNTTKPFECLPETVPGIHVCMPEAQSRVSSPVRVQAMGTLDTSIFRFELWSLDTKRASISDSGAMDVTVPLPPGDQFLTFVARSAQGLRTQTNFSITVDSPDCPAPSGTAINVCSPVNGSTVHSPVYAHARAKLSQFVYRFELWVDGNKLVSLKGDLINQSLNLPLGKHKFDFVARDSVGTRVVKTVYTTVN